MVILYLSTQTSRVTVEMNKVTMETFRVTMVTDNVTMVRLQARMVRLKALWRRRSARPSAWSIPHRRQRERHARAVRRAEQDDP